MLEIEETWVKHRLKKGEGKKNEHAIYGQPLFTIADGFLGSLNPRVFVPTAANVPCQDKIDGKQILNMHNRTDGTAPVSP